MMIQSEPRIGTSKTYLAAIRHMARSITPMTRYGASFASTISIGRAGVTNRDSSVPRSHSRAISREVRKAPISVMTSTTRPGTRNHVLLLASLNHVRCRTVTLADAAAGLPCRSAIC